MAGPRALVVGHNPSKADAIRDDQTIRILRNRLIPAGYSGFTIVNLVAAIATEPQTLLRMLDPEGPENDRHIENAFAAKPVAMIVAWGGISVLGTDADLQREWFLKKAKRRGIAVLCFGKTKSGAPRHPSRLAKTARLVPFFDSADP